MRYPWGTDWFEDSSPPLEQGVLLITSKTRIPCWGFHIDISTYYAYSWEQLILMSKLMGEVGPEKSHKWGFLLVRFLGVLHLLNMGSHNFVKGKSIFSKDLVAKHDLREKANSQDNPWVYSLLTPRKILDYLI